MVGKRSWFFVRNRLIQADHKKILFAVTQPPQKNCLYSNFFIYLPENVFFFFLISSSHNQFFNFFCISLQKCWECALVNKGATERKINCEGHLESSGDWNFSKPKTRPLYIFHISVKVYICSSKWRYFQLISSLLYKVISSCKDIL